MYVDKGVLVASASARRRVVVVGSSGGSTVQFPAPVEFLEALSQQLARISQGAAVVAAQFVCCEVALGRRDAAVSGVAVDCGCICFARTEVRPPSRVGSGQ